jgi:hypothetical protein
MTDRPNKIIVSSGFKGAGKSYQSCKLIQSYLLPPTGYAPRKVIIFDTNMEYVTENIRKHGFNWNIKTIHKKHTGLFIKHPEVCAVRLVPIHDNGRLMNMDEKKLTAWSLVQNFHGGLIVLDDLNTYVLDITHEKDLVGAICNNAHRNADILINFQSINMINPILMRNTNELRMHYQNDGIDEKFKEHWEILMIGKNIVDAKYRAGDTKNYVYILCLDFKIKGAFSKNDFIAAAYRYITEQNTKKLSQALNKYGKSNRTKAIQYALQPLMNYYGN